jgi:hypothetical protein
MFLIAYGWLLENKLQTPILQKHIHTHSYTCYLYHPHQSVRLLPNTLSTWPTSVESNFSTLSGLALYMFNKLGLQCDINTKDWLLFHEPTQLSTTCRKQQFSNQRNLWNRIFHQAHCSLSITEPKKKNLEGALLWLAGDQDRTPCITLLFHVWWRMLISGVTWN